MQYKKIEIELIVAEDEAEDVAIDLSAALDGLESKYQIFGGAIRTETVEHSETWRRSALTHTIGAGQTAVSAIRVAGERVANALRAVI